MPWYLEGAATPEEDGPNWTPPTMGNFLAQEKATLRRLREADAYKQVAREAKEFHEDKALKYGVHTGRGMAHLKASLGYAKEAAGRLQEMFAQGGDPAHMDELPPKAIIKANKAAMKFHQGQAQKAGLDSDVGHAHIAAMEHHGDILQKAKKLHQQSKQQQQPQGQPMQASSEGGPGSGRHKGGNPDHSERRYISHLQRQINHHISKGNKAPNRAEAQMHDRIVAKLMDKLDNFNAEFKREAAPGISGKQSPVPVPKKSEQPSEDIRQNKPPIGLNPQDANKPGAMRQLQQNESRKRIHSFEADAMDDVNMHMKRTLPPKVKKQMGDDLIYRAHRTKRESSPVPHVSPKDQDPKANPGFVDKRYAGVNPGMESRRRRSTRESNRQRFPREAEVDLREFYTKPERNQGWRGGVAFSPGVKPAEEQVTLFMKEF